VVVGCCCMGDFFVSKKKIYLRSQQQQQQQVSHQNPTRGSTREIRRHNALAAFFDQTRTKQGRRRNIWKLYTSMYIKLRHGLREKVHVERTRNTSVLPLRHSIISCGEQAHLFWFHFSFSGWKIKINKILRFVDLLVSIFLFFFSRKNKRGAAAWARQ